MMVKQELILLAINDSAVVELMQRALHAAGYAVAVAADRPAADRSVQEAIPTLLIVSELFDGEEGLSVADGLLERFPTLPVILYSSQFSNGLAEDVLRHGLGGYLYPPLRSTDIAGEVGRCIIRARKLGDWLRREVKRTTASLEQKARLSEAERGRLETIVSNIQDVVIVLDQTDTVIMVNQAAVDIFQLSNKTVVGAPLTQTIQNADLNALLQRAGGGMLKYHEVHFDDGRVFNAQYTPVPNIGGVITMQDISYLKELDRLKTEFIHTVSHDLRSPLTAVMGYTELVGRVGPLNENQREFVNRIQGSIQHITTLVNELLDLGRLEAGFDMRREMVRLDNVVQYSLDMFDGQIKGKRLNLSLDVASDIAPLRANPIRIRQMMDNLVGNAIKYTPPGGTINVSLSSQNGQLIIRVADSGMGIPVEEQGRVFEKFYRASNSPDGVEGTGLGLAIVKSIVDSHQGRVWVESNPEGGSVFTVLLPPQE